MLLVILRKFLVLCIYFASVTKGANVTLKVGRGQIIGSQVPGSPVEFFGGIPFAKPPVGNLRLKPAVLTTALPNETFDATQFGLSCLQKGFTIAPSAMSEDCLTLNIFRPAGASTNDKLPVLLWIYGGMCTGSSSLYNATSLVTKSLERGTPVIYASVNYRLGPLGFPQGTEAGSRGALNLGLKDQLTALEWMQVNIGAFGGDKSKITIFGQSAGATSITIHLLGDAISKLARGAIIESNVAAPAFPPEKNQASWQSFVTSTPGCSSVANTSDTFDCLQTASQVAVMQGFLEMPGGSFGATIDGPGGILPDIPSNLEPKARFPLITGSVKDEFTLFTSQTINSTEEIRQGLNNSFSPSARGEEALTETIEKILELYPDIPALGSPFGTGNDTFGLSSQYKRSAAIEGDILVQVPRRLASQQKSKTGVKIFSYLFTDPDAVPMSVLVSTNPPPAAVTHTSEIPYVYGTLKNITDTAVSLSQMMQDYWISFTVSLNPNDGKGGKRPNWAQYTPNSEVVLRLDGRDGVKLIQDNFRAKVMAFLSSDPAVFDQ
ncbi:hypothetical protein M422DRAFT_163417 [Sphaerobolus stellatus SS14]|uniref:Carboxylic ester hydrolase n=1 Tax=Sphaerobolus stellatus (strain SS14) TaxID=990650 RepID=A0A0C9UVW9_SPHS4|nr:hypothetical protein M422DRAFT_163417 [Sphaerobolus stellatus SS14]